MTTVNTSQYIFFGSLSAATAGLVDTAWALFRQSNSSMSAKESLLAVLIGIGVILPFGVLLGILSSLIAHKFSLKFFIQKLKRPVPAISFGLFIFFATASIIYAGYKRGIILDALDLRPFVLPLIALLILFVGVGLKLLSKLVYSKASIVLICTCLGTASAGLTQVHKHSYIPNFLSTDTALSKPIFNGMRNMFDNDKDGFPRKLCSADCDCDDKNPQINPTATEIPNNNIDEDCSGSDFKLVSKDIASLQSDVKNTITYPIEFRPPMNIVLITIDTLRADRLHVYGHDRQTSPNLDAFAKENVMFSQVRSQGPSTRHIFPVFLTGRYFPTILQDKGKKWWTLKNENVTFAEILKEKGYTNFAVLPYFRFKEQSGFHQGFDIWEPVLDEGIDPTWSPTGHLVTERGIKHLTTLTELKSPWLLWLHYFDPHASYIKHEDQPSFGNARADLYDGEVFFVDKQVEKVFNSMKSKGLWNNTAIIVTSDHGEGIGLETDHGFNYHGFSLYDSETRIPFLIRAPGIEPKIVNQSVALIDLTPTLLELGGADIPSNMHGYSLVPYVFGKAEKRPPFLMHLPEATAWEAIVDWPYKLIWEKKPNRYKLYNLETDPNEQRDLVLTEKETTERLTNLMKLENYRIQNSPVR